jgi:hypothetical protein
MDPPTRCYLCRRVYKDDNAYCSDCEEYASEPSVEEDFLYDADDWPT